MESIDVNLDLLKRKIVDYSLANGYEATHFGRANCEACSSGTFRLAMNEAEGVALRLCTACGAEHGIGDSDRYLEDVEELFEVSCTCGGGQFRILAGVALYPGSEDVRWFYLGCHCTACGASGVFGDWKNEAPDYKAILARV